MNQQDLLSQAYSLYSQGKLAESGSLCRRYLQQFPRDVNAIRLYARLAERMDKSAEATVIYRKLLAIQPGDLDSLNALARHHYHNEEYRSAREYVVAALRVDPNSADALMTLGAVTLLEGDEERGKALLAQSRSLGADDLAVDEIIFQYLIVQGQFDAARDLARQLIRRWPTISAMYAKLAAASKFTAENADTALIRSMLDDEGRLRPAFKREERDEVEAYQALYKLEYELGNYAHAWKHLENMKAPLRKAAPRAHREERRERCELIKQVFTRDFIASRAEHAFDTHAPIFVVGMPRSGTTLLERVLATGAGVVPAGERVELERVMQEICAHFGENQYDLRALHNAPLQMWQQVGEQYVQRVQANLPEGDFFIDKTPANFANIGFIRAILPRARIVHISRHPVANCFSIYEQNFGVRHAYNLDQKSLGEYYLDYVDIMQHWRELLPGEFVDVRYEDLVSDPAAVIRSLSKRLALDLDSNTLALTQAGGSIHTASYWQARQPVMQSSINRWTRYREQLGPLIEVLQPLLAEEAGD